MFSRLRNLYRINKMYGYLRDLKENPAKFNNSKHWTKIVETAFKITEVQEMMKGYKTYLVAAAIAAAAVGKYFGVIDDSVYETLVTLLGAGGAATLAAKINRQNGQLKSKDGIR